MPETVHISAGLRVLAFICKICPCCIIARRWPDSSFARKFRKVQRLCPFCRAYERVKITLADQSEQGRPVPIRRADQAAAE